MSMIKKCDHFRKDDYLMSKERKDNIFNVKLKADELMYLYNEMTQSREQSLAKTNLEQSVMWAVKSLSINPN